MLTNAQTVFKAPAAWGMDEAFPDVDPGYQPIASAVIVQLRTPRQVSSGGIILPGQARDTEKWNTQIAKVRAIGDLCFKDRKTLVEFPEGPWFGVGDFVRVPLYGGDRWEEPVPGTDDPALFMALESEFFIRLKHIGDPLAAKMVV